MENSMEFSYTTEGMNKAKAFTSAHSIKYIQLGYVDINGALLGKQIRIPRFWAGFESGACEKRRADRRPRKRLRRDFHGAALGK
jgi:hypothetical protein